MKKIMLLILISIGLLFCAEFKKVSYERDILDMDARQNTFTDDNGNKTGLLKIHSDQSELLVESNLGIVKTDKSRPGEFWVYLSPGEKWIKISKEGFVPFEFVLEPSIESDTVFVLKLQTLSGGSLMGDLHKITFRFNEANVYVAKGTSAPVMCSGKSSENWLPNGDYEFTFIKEGFVDKKQKVSVKGDAELDIVLVSGSNQTILKVPAIVSISSDPPGAEIFLNGQKFGLTPMQESLLSGEYNLTLRKNFYYPEERTFEVKEGQTMELPLMQLKKKYGYFSVNADLPGVKFYKDEVYLGDNSISKIQIESGKHTFKAELDLFHTETQEIEFKDGDEKDVIFKMRPNYGKLSVISEPSEAQVWLNGKLVGITPFTDEKMKSGKYVVKITKELWSDYDDIVEVFDEKASEKSYVLNRNFGKIIVKAENSEIYINGVKKGSGTYQDNLQPGKYTVTAKRDKHRNHEKEVFINIGREQEVVLTPDPIMGSVNIFSDPMATNGAAIFINEEEKGKTPSVIPLLIGDYNLKLTLEGYLDANEQFNIAEGENKTLRVKMQTYEGSQKEKRNFWKKQKWYALGAFAISTGAGSYFYMSGNSYYDDYKNATTRNSSTEEAMDLFDKAETADKYRNISFSVSVAPLCYFFYSWYKESSYK